MTPTETERRDVEYRYERRHPERRLGEEASLPLALAALSERLRVWEQGARDWQSLRDGPAGWVVRGLELCPGLRQRPWFRRLWELERAGAIRVPYAPMLPLFGDGDDTNAVAIYLRVVALHALDECHGLTRKAFALADRHRRRIGDSRIAALRDAISRPDAPESYIRQFAEQWREMVGAGLARRKGHPTDEPRLAFLDGVHLKCIASGYDPPTHQDLRDLALWSGVERISPDACRVWVRDHAPWSNALWQGLSSWRTSPAEAKP
jgi:hypothetical protein